MQHEFVKNIPNDLKEDILYISMEYGTVVHKCCCGCGNKVFTPLTPTDWQLTYDGESISLYPSVGNWNLRCQSHYWITGSQIRWAPKWSKTAIQQEHNSDRKLKQHYYSENEVMHKYKEETKGKNYWKVFMNWINLIYFKILTKAKQAIFRVKK